MNPDILLRAYAILGDETPMLTDCGLLCGAACCRPDEDGQGGVHLFPGERALISGQAWARVLPSPFAPVMLCDGTCERSARPLGCRIFPLSPARGKNGKWTVRIDARSRAMCPLAASGIGGLNPKFVRSTRDALRLIAGDPEGDAFLERWCALEEEYRKPLW